jgi:hypothetical protein
VKGVVVVAESAGLIEILGLHSCMDGIAVSRPMLGDELIERRADAARSGPLRLL